MKIVATVNVIIFIIAYGIAIYIGVDLKKWWSRLLSLYCFLTFFFIGIVGTREFYESMKIGVIATFVFIIGGAITYWNRERARKWLHEDEARELESIQKLDMRNHSKNKKRVDK